jgi:hypothetical protein
MTPTVTPLCKNLYPPRHRPSRRSTRTSPRHQASFNPTLETLRKALSSLKPGTTYGPYNDFTDTLKACALFSSSDQTYNNKRLATVLQVVNLIINDLLPPGPAPASPPAAFWPYSKTPTTQQNSALSASEPHGAASAAPSSPANYTMSSHLFSSRKASLAWPSVEALILSSTQRLPNSIAPLPNR